MAIRRNLCPVPAAKYGTTAAGSAGSWFGSGYRVTNLSGFPRTTGYQLNSYADGGPPRGVVSSGSVTLSAYVRCSSAGSLPVSINWYSGNTYVGSAGTTNFSVSAGVVRRISLTATRPSSANQALLYFNGRFGTTVITAVLIEQGATLGDYFDGDSDSGAWDGTDGASTSTVQDTQTVTVPGIPTAEAFGAATLSGTATIDLDGQGIESGETFGETLIEYAKVRAQGIESAEAFGRPTLVPGPAQISPLGIPSAAVFGTPKLRTSLNLSGQIGARRRGITYDLVMVARVPSASGPPTLLEVDSIVWKGLSWAEELSKPQRLDVSTSMGTLTDAVLRRLTNGRDLPSELHLYRGGRKVFAGPLMNGQRQGETVTLYAQGLLGYARYWFVESDLVFSQKDQFIIARGLVDHYQSLEFGNYGIDTSQVGESGVLRDATYLAKENHPIGQRIEELGQRQNGFDADVDPITRALKLFYPIKGIDRSVGVDAIVFDGSNITSANVAWSTAPGDIASEGYGTGTTAESSLRSQRSNLDVRAQFGRSGVAASFDGVSEQSTLDQHTQALVDARGESLIVPGPDVRVTPDVDPTSYTVGDTIAYVLPDRLGVVGSYRLRKRTIKVSDTGRELASFEFA